MTCTEAAEMEARHERMSDEELAAAGKMTRVQRSFTEANRWLAGFAAKKIKSPLLDFDEKMAAAFLGICRATLEFRPELGFKYSTFAVCCAKQAILNEIRSLRSAGLVAQIDAVRGVQDPSGYAAEPIDPGDRADDARPTSAIEVEDILGAMPSRHAHVLRARAADRTLASIAAELRVSKERVRQIESAGLRKARALAGMATARGGAA